ncbi:uncharacterized protein LOC143468435 [Clavelina lepadiformis]|uniref:Uncharacterized protein n=1 Tax=Clavelina lepadiformis TaxID=159417 RepID=A0ABP0FZZ9_CLALP
MARSGPVGGPATLSSFRVQKAFSINFRENKRLSAEVRVIENEHIRNIRLVKQEIKDTRLWLDKIRESTGESSDGLRPSSADKAKKANKKRRIPVRSKTVEPIIIKREQESNFSTDDENSEKELMPPVEPLPHVHFVGSEVKPATLTSASVAENKASSVVRPWTEAPSKSDKNGKQARDTLKSEPAINDQNGTRNETFLTNDSSARENPMDNRRNRVHSAASGRSSLASLTAYQRRHKLQAMMVKKQNPLEYKRFLNSKECSRVNAKVSTYLEGLADRMVITIPDLSLWNIDLESHDTPFAKDVNITS